MSTGASWCQKLHAVLPAVCREQGRPGNATCGAKPISPVRSSSLGGGFLQRVGGTQPVGAGAAGAGAVGAAGCAPQPGLSQLPAARLSRLWL